MDGAWHPCCRRRAAPSTTWPTPPRRGPAIGNETSSAPSAGTRVEPTTVLALAMDGRLTGGEGADAY
ncbi:hypothetical protein [Streptomyces spectabilis]|uniref:Uncharacterized protein n=1 Tax=Streptomyces spectabilis TaxID=68270 RepID=A0A516R2D2_STRST|nr:hypothetical protein [Streptomyces spectabilis]QDQ09823.1 hypothetical protein FH965_03990 [Streptomyces spectabilis]